MFDATIHRSNVQGIKAHNRT